MRKVLIVIVISVVAVTGCHFFEDEEEETDPRIVIPEGYVQEVEPCPAERNENDEESDGE